MCTVQAAMAADPVFLSADLVTIGARTADSAYDVFHAGSLRRPSRLPGLPDVHTDITLKVSQLTDPVV